MNNTASVPQYVLDGVLTEVKEVSLYDNITPGMSLVDDVGLDSLDLAELEFALEDRFKIELDIKGSPRIEDANTINDVAEIVAAVIASDKHRRTTTPAKR